MISVKIFINDREIFDTRAVNLTPHRGNDEVNVYQVDNGHRLSHKKSDGALKLAMEMLKHSKEPK